MVEDGFGVLTVAIPEKGAELVVPKDPFGGVGAEATIEAMDEYSRWEIGRKTYLFAKACMRDPVLRAKIKARAAELEAEELAATAAG
ncbi:MAG: hypothetical protein IJW45_08415 [Oscillospiraceae bacterium]|nr:hypothetical protein [Oscillospiraceae bacterium]